MRFEVSPLIALDEDIKDFSTIRILNKFSYLMWILSLLSTITGLAFTFFSFSIFSIILLIYGIFFIKFSRDMIKWTRHIRECRESSNNLYRVEVSQSLTTDIFLNSLIFMAFSALIASNIFIRIDDYSFLIKRIVDSLSLGDLIEDYQIKKYILCYLGANLLTLVFSYLSAISAKKYITFQYSAYSDMIFYSNTLLLFASLIIIWICDQIQEFKVSDIIGSIFPEWLIESSRTLSYCFAGISLLIWIVNSRQYRIGYSLLLIILFFSIIISTFITTGSWLYSKRLHNQVNNQPLEERVLELASMNMNDIQRHGCLKKYIDYSLNCEPGTQFKIWENNSIDTGCINLSCSRLVPKIITEKYFDLSNLLFSSVLSQFFVFLGLYNFSFNFTFVYNDGKKTKDYLWLFLMIILTSIGTFGFNLITHPDNYIGIQKEIDNFKITTETPLFGLNHFTKALSHISLEELDKEIKYNNISFIGFWNPDTKIFEKDTIPINFQDISISSCSMRIQKIEETTFIKLEGIQANSTCSKDRWIIRQIRSELLNSGAIIYDEMADIQNGTEIQDTFLWSIINSDILDSIDNHLNFYSNFTLISWNYEINKLTISYTGNNFNDVSKYISNNDKYIVCLYSVLEENFKETIAISIPGSQKLEISKDVELEFTKLFYQFKLRGISNFHVEKSNFKKDKIYAIVKSV